MRKQPQLGRTEIPDISRVEHLLELLKDLSPRDPSPALRERLSNLASHRLQTSDDAYQKFSLWLRPVLAAVLLVAVGLAAAWVMHLQRQGPRLAKTVTQANRTQTRSGDVHNAPAVPVAQAASAESPKNHHVRFKPASNAGARRMVLQLPYSNNNVSTGTDATIRVLMSQSELMSLGFPLNATPQDRRIVAELTLGDDGLPRAISLPLPLEVMKEKK